MCLLTSCSGPNAGPHRRTQSLPWRHQVSDPGRSVTVAWRYNASSLGKTRAVAVLVIRPCFPHLDYRGRVAPGLDMERPGAASRWLENDGYWAASSSGDVVAQGCLTRGYKWCCCWTSMKRTATHRRWDCRAQARANRESAELVTAARSWQVGMARLVVGIHRARDKTAQG